MPLSSSPVAKTTGEGDREAVEGAVGRQSGSRRHMPQRKTPLAFTSGVPQSQTTESG